MIKIIVILALLIGIAAYFNFKSPDNQTLTKPLIEFPISLPSLPSKPSPPSPTPTPIQIPISKTLNNNYHIFQTYNNCGPAALSMTLSYYGIQKTQAELGEQLRPYQVPGGDNDDSTKEFIQDDSLQGKNLRYSYDEFDKIWDKFNYVYLVLIPREKQKLAEQILGENLNVTTAWLSAVSLSIEKLKENPNDITARFNLSVAYYRLGYYEASVKEFEKVENQLPFRTLWYQIDPILAYYELKDYNRVIEISDKILNYHNRAFSELYILKGNIYLKRGDKEAARTEFQKAVQYNKNLKAAKKALLSIN